MRTGLTLFAIVAALINSCSSVLAQEWSNDGGGNIHCDPLLPPQSVTIGNGTTVNLATLNVRGDEMPVNDQFTTTWRCTFRTDVPSGFNQTWDMVRGGILMGRIWHTNPGNAFTVQSMQGPLRLRNQQADGIHVNGNNTNTLNGYTNNLVGYSVMGSSAALTALTNTSPWSRLHLVHENLGTSPDGGFRPWMRNGMLGTGNSDLYYIGHKYAMTGGTGAEQDDNCDVVAAWFDNVLPAGVTQAYNNYSFRYLGDLGVGGSAGTIEGLEMMRLRPFRMNAADPIEGYVGIGDWVNSGGQLPTQRLDLLNGKVRIRQLPSDPVSSAATKMMVVNTDGVVGWQNIPTGSGAGCDWEVAAGGDVITAYQPAATAGACPEEDNRVGIGIATASAKLHVKNDPAHTLIGRGAQVDNNWPSATASTGEQIGIAVNTTGVTGFENYAGIFQSYGGGGSGYYGLQAGLYSKAECTGTATNVAGTWSQGTETAAASGVSKVFGVRGGAEGHSAASEVVGVFGEARRFDNAGTGMLIGVRGYAYDANGGAAGTVWAGYFDGNVNLNGDLYRFGVVTSISDESLKNNVQPLTGSLDKVKLLQPASYGFNVADHPGLGLSDGTHLGFIAQQVQDVLPELVNDVHMPAEQNEMGDEIHPATTYLGVNYEEILPLLTGAIQELDATVSELKEQLNACCSAQDGTGTLHMLSDGGTPRALANDQRLLIHPNPFTSTTNIAVALDRATRVSMTVMGLNGQAVKALDLGEAQPGIFTYTWDTSDMAAGQYVITILLDGKAETAQVVKLADR